MATRTVVLLVALATLLGSSPVAAALPDPNADIVPLPAAPVPRTHLTRRRRNLSSSHSSPAILARQVHNSTAALSHWEKRDEVARRAEASAKPGVCNNSVGAYQQCGGPNWTTDTCCVNGYTCQYQSEWYSQCVPSASTSTMTTTTSAAPSATSKVCKNSVTGYSQCGGQNWTGDSCCVSGFSCVYSNEYYSQCLPIPSSLPTTSSTTTTTSAKPSSTTSTSAAPSATPKVCNNSVPGYSQCGGQNWTGDTCCVFGYSCVYSSQFYSQCLPVGGTTSTTSSTTTTSNKPFTSTTQALAASSTSSSTSSAPSSTPSAACSGLSSSWGQCGGQGYTGPTCCPSGWTCTYSNPFYSQCLQSPTTSTTTTQAPSSASSTRTTTTSSVAPSTVASYQQCGGLGTALSPCQSGFFCAYVNDYYYQCLPKSASSFSSAPSSTPTSFSTITRVSSTSSSSTTTSAAPSSSSSAATCPASNAYAQCDGFLWWNEVCCPTGYYCQYQSMFYSQCVPGSASTSSSTSPSSTKASSTSTSSTALPSSSGSCKPNSNTSDGCTPYTVSAAGVTLPAGSVFPDGGHVNYQAIPKSQYKDGQSYCNPGSNWTPQGFGVHFESLNNQPSGIYIGRNFMDWSAAAKAFPSGYCITWVQYSDRNEHFGEGCQTPICTP